MVLLKVLRIGTHESNELIFNDASVSPHHAQINIRSTGMQFVDLGSEHGSTIAGARVDRANVSIGDEIALGRFRFVLTEEHLGRARSSEGSEAMRTVQETLSDLSAISRDELRAEAAPQEGATQVITLGYHETNTISIAAPQVSGYHARISKVGESFEITDLRSTNGTFVNGERVVETNALQVNDVIGLGSYQFKFDESLLRHFNRTAAKTLAIDIGAVDWSKAGEHELTLGRADDNDIVIPAPQVSGYHATLRAKDGGWLLRDIGSLNGTYINVRSTPVVPHSEVFLSDQDVLFLGSYRFPVARLSEYTRTKRQSEAVALPEDKDVITIGRGEGNDLVVDAPQVSRDHARLRREGDIWILEDLGSANGTYVDGVRITRCEITPENLIAFGTYVVRLDPTKGVVHKEYQGEIMLRGEDITVDVKDAKSPSGRKRLLDGISFTAYPTEFIGIMGPSGAGKTTLMMALNGYLPPSGGSSLINNLDIYRHYDQFRDNIGYVPQDDIIHRELTVFESLYYTAKLRLPPDTSSAEIERLIDRILESLGILETKHVRIGSPIQKGISGGQRKRVNLAQELITQPSLLFLDEPTSGLASSDTRSVMQLLRRLADEGRTILLTIHQPSLDVYREMDNVLYLARGKLVYYGSTYPDSILYFNPQAKAGTPDGDKILSNPDAAMAPIAEDNSASDATERIARRHDEYLESTQHRDYVAGRRDNAAQVQLTQRSRRTRKSWMFVWRQWWVLARRTMTIKRKDLTNSAILLLQAPIIGVLLAIVFNLKMPPTGSPVDQFMMNQGSEGADAAALFMLVASAVWFGTSNSAREIVGELAIYRRERMVNLKIPSYVLSKFFILSLLSLVQCTILLGIVHPLIGFHGSFSSMLVVLFLCSTAGLGVGLTLSALVRSTEAAVALVPLLLIPQLVLGGLIVPLKSLEGGARVAVRQSANLMVSRWAYEGLLHVEQDARPLPPEIVTTVEEREAARRFAEAMRDGMPAEKRRKMGSLRLPTQEETERRGEMEALFKTRLAETLNSNQRDQTLIARYFGEYSSSLLSVIAMLLFFNVALLLLVCLILRMKDSRFV
ncbi:MAG: hypothetical protein AUK47_28605 [Deltaproteobacteria bacterium CG2_30_63_29]|nr:MAG: hypothetical protein AUK47_28605 [Deltaproteobacteria bacterium CG2_30_63_29]